MGLIYLGIFVLAIAITGITEYRRFLRTKLPTKTFYAKTGKKK
jgi:hypothetical protein